MKIALIDFDGTLVDHGPSMRAAALEVLGEPLSLEEISALPVRERSRLYDVNMGSYPHLYEHHAEVVEFVRGLAAKGFELRLLTARPCGSVETIRGILGQAGLDMEIICRQEDWVKDQEYKLEYIRSLDADSIVLLEDKKRNIDYIRSRLPGIEAYLVVRGRLQKE